MPEEEIKPLFNPRVEVVRAVLAGPDAAPLTDIYTAEAVVRALDAAASVPTVRDVGGRLVIGWPDPRPRSFTITAEAFEALIARANGDTDA